MARPYNLKRHIPEIPREICICVLSHRSTSFASKSLATPERIPSRTNPSTPSFTVQWDLTILSGCQSLFMWGAVVSPSHSPTWLRFHHRDGDKVVTSQYVRLEGLMWTPRSREYENAEYCYASDVEKIIFSFFAVLNVSDKAVESLTAGLVLGAALRDVGAQHRADSWVRREAPGGFLAIWIPTVVFSQVSGKHRKNHPVICYKCMQVGVRVDACLMWESDSLAGVGLRYECVVMGILRVPALAAESSGHQIYCPSVTLSSALVTLGRFHHITFRRRFWKRVKQYFKGAADIGQGNNHIYVHLYNACEYPQ